MSAFARLHPRLQHAIVHELGWRQLRPVQNQAIEAILDGHNAVVLAPTAGGKTEAAIFPVLSRILTEDTPAVAALYICPIRALLNNQEPRLSHYARMVGMEVFKWHGDVADTQKGRFRVEPTHLLMTTPESLEVMLISQRTDARELFAHLSTVIVDEVHAFANDDRGAHLVAVLERLSRFCGRDVQRIGLSATVGNPRDIGTWLQGSSRRAIALIDPPRPSSSRAMSIHYAQAIETAAPAIAQLARGKKSLVFVESRARAEKVVRAMEGRGVDVYVHHSSVSRADRTSAEAQLAEGDNTAIVATSTMELGIDVGDLDQVVQVEAPSSVASFLQRIGRTGRRAGTRSNCTFFCTTPESLLQTVALLTLADRGWVEDVTPADQAMHVLAHQILALTLQEDGLSRWRALPWLAAAFPFAGLDEERVQHLVDTMLERDILYEADGLLSLGHKGERLYGRRNFFELYAVFSSPPVLHVLHGRTEVGQVQARFVQTADPEDGPLVFRLGGGSWRVTRADYARGRLFVKPASGGKVPTWLGQPSMLSFDLCQEMLRVLVGGGEEPDWLSPAAAQELDFLREDYNGLLELGAAPLEYTEEGVQWHTFAGGAVNRLLAAGMEELTGQRWTAGNLSLKAKDVALTQATEAVCGLMGLDWDQAAADVASKMVRGAVSKFQPCLPPEEEARLLVAKLLDVPRTLEFLATVRVGGRRLVGERHRLEDAPVGEPVQLTIRLAPDEPAVPQQPWELVETDEALVQMVEVLEAAPVVALDVETTLVQHVPCLVQLAVPGRTWLVDALVVRDLAPLARVFASERVVKLIHYASFERRVLSKVGFELVNVVDTHELSRTLRPGATGGHSLAMVCERELGLSLDKVEQTSDWTRRPLGSRQLAYAALDAEVLLQLYRVFQEAGVVDLLDEGSP